MTRPHHPQHLLPSAACDLELVDFPNPRPQAARMAAQKKMPGHLTTGWLDGKLRNLTQDGNLRGQLNTHHPTTLPLNTGNFSK